MMVTLGTDAHKKSHTMVAIDDVGAEIASAPVAATPEGHMRVVKCAARREPRRWAIEDCRALSRRLEADLLRIGDQVVRVPPKLMAGARRSARTRGKSDPIDALAVARAGLGNRICRWLGSMAPPARYGCWSTTEKAWSKTEPQPSTGCGGGSTNSNPATTRHQVHSTDTRPSTTSTSSLGPIRQWWPPWDDVKSPGSES